MPSTSVKSRSYWQAKVLMKPSPSLSIASVMSMVTSVGTAGSGRVTSIFVMKRLVLAYERVSVMVLLPSPLSGTTIVTVLGSVPYSSVSATASLMLTNSVPSPVVMVLPSSNFSLAPDSLSAASLLRKAVMVISSPAFRVLPSSRVMVTMSVE